MAFKYKIILLSIFLGDGNLHLQISLHEYNEKSKEYFENIVYKRVEELNGSVSAEHGIGIFKRKALKHSKSTPAIQFMKEVKQMMDPNKILNPYKIFE